jgi:hypothetical protein
MVCLIFYYLSIYAAIASSGFLSYAVFPKIKSGCFSQEAAFSVQEIVFLFFSYPICSCQRTVVQFSVRRLSALRMISMVCDVGRKTKRTKRT